MCSKCYRDSQLNAERKVSNSKAAISALSEVHSLPEVHEVLGAKQVSPAPAQPVPQPSPQPERPPAPRDQRQGAESSSKEGVAKAEASVGSEEALFERPAQKPGRCFACNKKVSQVPRLCKWEMDHLQLEHLLCGNKAHFIGHKF